MQQKNDEFNLLIENCLWIKFCQPNSNSIQPKQMKFVFNFSKNNFKSMKQLGKIRQYRTEYRVFFVQRAQNSENINNNVLLTLLGGKYVTRVHQRVFA